MAKSYICQYLPLSPYLPYREIPVNSTGKYRGGIFCPTLILGRWSSQHCFQCSETPWTQTDSCTTRERLSSETQLVSLIEGLARKSSLDKQTDLILLDFSKAFNKVKLFKASWNYTPMKLEIPYCAGSRPSHQQKTVIEGAESRSQLRGGFNM